MHTFYYKTTLEASLPNVWRFFSINENLTRVTGFPKVTVNGDRYLYEGALIDLSLQFMFIKVRWKGVVSEVVDDVYFVDEGRDIPFPFQSWRHVHAFKAVSGSETAMIDQVTYGSSLPPFLVNFLLSRMFADRKRQLNKLFQA